MSHHSHRQRPKQNRSPPTPARSLLKFWREPACARHWRFGCGAGDRGACTVHIDGKRDFACQTPAAEADGKSVTTIEGLAHNDRLHPLQQAFMDESAYQCGYCVSGMIMAAGGAASGKAQSQRCRHPSVDESKSLPLLRLRQDRQRHSPCRRCGEITQCPRPRKPSRLHQANGFAPT